MVPACINLVQVARGVKTVLLTSERFDAEEAWSLVERWRITDMFAVPTIVKLLTEHPAVHRHDHPRSATSSTPARRCTGRTRSTP